MNAQNFFDQNINKYIEFNGDPYKNQCVDLVQKYINDVLGTPQIRANAKDFFDYADERYYTKIKNTIWNFPQIGDIVVFGTAIGAYGHVAIVKSANVFNFISFDQNFPLNTPAHFQNHNYFGVIGWLRAKVPTTPTAPAINVFKVRVDKAVANVRTAPSLSAPLGGSQTLYRGDVFDAVDIVEGDYFQNINKWYKSAKGNYVWAGGLTKI